jgi:GT2 family glycosyltransferase
MLRRAALDEVGLFDERFFMYSEDEDLCFRLKQRGWKICHSQSGTVFHQGAASTKQNRLDMLREFYASQMFLLLKHRGITNVRIYIALMRVVLGLKRRVLPFLGKAKAADDNAERLRALGIAWDSSDWR